MKRIAFLIVAIFCAIAVYGQKIEIKDTIMGTYGFSNADPIPEQGKIYPYWKFRQFTNSPEQKSWRMVVLENDYLRVKVFPEIGGKIWSIYDKTSGNEMFYDNNVVKFREIALRGPWTSGGIEFNFGVIGHAPSCAHPVDWKTENKQDGSVSCYIGVSDLLSRSRWTIEINLPKDAIWVRTSMIWHNSSKEYQPYYTWANSGVKTSDDTKLIYPADAAIGHLGEPLEYPKDSLGRDLSYYRTHTFGPDKSFHMVGSHKGFFGAYYENEDRGVLHYSRRDGKLGRKYFEWALSEQGTIWIDLLSDSKIQYIEMQSGRLYNQNMVESSQRSSYRQILFTPYCTDSWDEYWLPFSGIGAADDVNLHAVTSYNNGELGIYPLQPFEGIISIKDATEKELFSEKISLKPAQVKKIKLQSSPDKVYMGNVKIWSSDKEGIDRPKEMNRNFDRNTVTAKLMMARDYIGLRRYKESEELVDEVLSEEKGNIDALSLKSFLLFNRMKYAEAYDYSTQALAIDQYNPEAGYFGGISAIELGKISDAMDRLEVASISSSSLKSACFTELAKLHFKNSDFELSSSYASKALKFNGENISAMFILNKSLNRPSDNIYELDPLSHIPSSDNLISGKMSKDEYEATFKEELPYQEHLEIALLYHSLGLDKDAVTVLETLSNQNILTELWRAFLKKDISLIPKAEEANIDYIFPFRRESYEVLNWAVKNSDSWKCRYLLALLKDSFGYKDEALTLLDCENAKYAPYYAYRYSLTSNTEDLKKAFEIDNGKNWIYRWRLATDLINKKAYAEAVEILEPYYKKHPVMQIGDKLIDVYILTGKYREAEKIIDKIEYLPFEGQKDSHAKYNHIKLYLAAKAIDAGKYDKAEDLISQALLWPARLGAGKPYDYMIDTTLETKLKEEIRIRKTSSGPFESATKLVDSYSSTDKKLF